MVCDGTRRSEPRVVQIGENKPNAIRSRVSNKSTEPIGDFHCGDCCLTLHRRSEKYHHNCPGYKEPNVRDPRREYQRLRKEKCDKCQHNIDGICEIEKQAHPDRPCVIEIGVRKPHAYCKIGEWGKVEEPCPVCLSNLFNANGVSACRYCGWAKDSSSRVKAGWSRVYEMHDEPSPKSKLAIVTIVIGENARDISKKTLPTIEQYAARCGADLIVLRDDQSPEYMLGNKFRTGTYVSHYDRTLFLNADIFIREETPDLFATFPEGSIYGHNDEAFMRDSGWLRAESYSLAQSQSVENLAIKCINTGVILCDRKHASIWNRLTKPFQSTHTSEQTWVGMNIRHSGFDYQELPVEFNTQWWFRSFSELSSSANMVHLAGCPHNERLFLFDMLEKGERQLPKTKMRK